MTERNWEAIDVPEHVSHVDGCDCGGTQWHRVLRLAYRWGVTEECPDCARLRDEANFWKDQQKLTSSVAATIADLDEEAPALRQLLRREQERRRKAEDECVALEHRLMVLTGTQP